MKIIGQGRLLSNDYKEIKIRQKSDGIECTVTGSKGIGNGNKLGSFENILSDAKTDSLKISEILKYFTRYTKIKCIKNKSFDDYNIVEFKGDKRKLTIDIKQDENISKVIECMVRSYYDNLFDECFKFIDDHYDCKIFIYNSQKSNHYKCINAEEPDEKDEIVIANSKSNDKYIVNFIKLLIDNYNGIIGVSALLDNLVLIIGRHKLTIPHNDEIKYYCFDHNIEVTNKKALQIKINGM